MQQQKDHLRYETNVQLCNLKVYFSEPIIFKGSNKKNQLFGCNSSIVIDELL